MSSFLTKSDGIYNPAKRYGVKNITDTDFTFTWNGNPITIKVGQEIELPEHMAILATTKMVDQVMHAEADEETARMRKELRDPYWRSPKGISAGIPMARKPYEDRVIRELSIDEKSPQYQVLRAEVKEQLLGDLKRGQEPAAPIDGVVAGIAQFGNPTAPKEFAEIPKHG